MPLDMNAWRAYGAELEERAAAAKGKQAKEEEATREDEKGVFERIAERQAEQGIEISGEIEAEEKDYTDEEITKEADALRYLAVTTAENVAKKLENNRTAAVYHDLLEDAWQTQQDFADAGIENQGTIVTEEDVAKAKARVIEEPLWSMAAKEAGQEFISAYADKNEHPFQSLAEGMRRTDANIAYWMTEEERLAKAKEIEMATGINAMALLGDNEAFRSAMNIYDHQRKVEAIVGTGGGLEASHKRVMAEVYKEFPGLEKLSYEDPTAAALALHDIHHVREARDTITAWKEAWRYGWAEQEYGILKDKEAESKASENDKARMKNLERQLSVAPITPPFLEAPWLTAVSGLAGSMPMMMDALMEGALWGAAGAAVGAATTAPAGGAGAVPGFFTGGARGMVRAIGRNAIGKGIAQGFTWGRRIGEFNNMYKAQRGQDFAEYQKMTDADGNRLLSDEAAASYSRVSGAAKAAVEVAPMELFLSKFKSSPQAQKVFRRIIEQGEMDRAFRNDVWRTMGGRGKDIAEVTLAEAGEEGAQQALGDLVHNQIEIDTGDTNAKNGGVTTPGQFMTRAAMATAAALPTSFLFGIMPAVGGAGIDTWRFSRLGKELEEIRQTYSANERQTMAGTVVVAELQRVAQDSRLKETSPKTQRKLLREELAGSGLEIAYIDTGLAKEQENGIEDVKKAGRAAGMSDEAIADTVEAGGILAVPVECYAQSEASPELLDAVSFSAEAEPMGRMKARAKAFYEAAKARLKETIERQKRLEEMITKELFPTEGEERDMAMEAMTLNPENPAQGFREIEEELGKAREAELKEATEAIRNGLPKEKGEAGAAWYEAWEKEHGRAPKEAEIDQMIYALATGAEEAPKVEGFSQNVKETKARIEEIDHKRKVLTSIKERMMSLTGKEMKETETLTGEGFRVYRSILSDLKSAENPKVTRAARIGALLFARHADIYAAAMRKRGAEYADYTAMDYYEKAFTLDISGRASGDGERLNQAAMYRHPAKTFSEFMGKVLNGEAGKSYYDMPLDNTLLRIYSDDVKHIQTGAHKHPLSMEEWDVLLRHLNNVDEAWRTKDTKKPRGMAVVVAFETEGKNYGAVLEFSETGIVFLKTAVAGSEKKVEGVLKINKREAGMRLHTGLPGRTAEAGDSHAAFTSHSLSLSSIQHILGIGNTPASIFEQSAWHGSPYQFSAFDLGAIGTGAGAQAHGWGLYFAADRTVAEAYKEGSLYEVEIPEDDVLLDEQKSYEKQPQKVKKALDKLLSHLTIEQLENWNDVSRLGKEKVIADIKRAMLESDGQTIYGTLCDLTNGEKEASLLLNKYGIKGIAYEDKNAGRGFVIFDDKAISIIERYNQEAANAQMAAERLQEDEKAWGKIVDSFMKGEIKSGVNSRIMGTPLVFQLIQDDLGIPIKAGVPLKIHYGILHKILRNTQKHALDITPDMMKELPTKLADPIMILKNRNGETKEVIPGEVVCVVDMKDAKENTVIVPITFAYKNGAYQVKTVFGKQSVDWFMERLLMGDALYANKEKTSAWIKPAGHQSPMGLSLGDSFYSSIKTDEDLVKEKMKNPALYQETHGETTMMQNGRRIVSLFASADESTFLHELGHVFLDDLRQLAAFDEASQKELATVDEWAAWHEGAAKEYENTPWAAEFRGYEAAILKAKKAGDAKALEKALAVWRHERFARAFELYLKEGEAPARGLKQVFRKFAAFLRLVYRVFRTDGGRASEAVERVMDRMIATDEEIEAAAQDKRYRDFTKAGGEKLLRESDKATYQRWHEKAKAEAKERLRKVITKKLERERKAQLAAERKSEEERFQAKLYEDPIYQAREAVKMAKDENAALLFYPTLEEYRAQDKKAPAMDTLVEKHMEEYRREKEKALLANAITPEEVEKAMVSSKYHALRLALEAEAFRRQAQALSRVGGRTRAAMEEVEAQIEGMPEESGEEKLTKEEVTARIKEAIQEIDGKDIPKIPIQDANRFDGLDEQELFVVARQEIEKLAAEKIVDPLGNEVYFAPGETETMESYALHLVVGQGKPVEAIRTKRVLGLSLAKETIANPLAIIVQENGRKAYLALYAGDKEFQSSIVVGVEEGQAVRVITSMLTADKKNDKKAAVREFKKRISGSKEVLYWEGLSGHSRPSSEAWASTLNAKLHPSGTFSIAEDAGESKRENREGGKEHAAEAQKLLELKKPAGNLPRSTVKRPSASAGSSALSIAEDAGESKGTTQPEKKAEPSKEKFNARALYRAIHRLRAAHRWGAEELSAIDAVAKAASKADLKAAWEKVKALLTTAHINEQELKEALRGQSQLYRDLARKELSAMTLAEATAIQTYRRQEIEAARRVEKCIKAENWEAAEEEKENQILAAAMAQEARKIREKVDIIRRRLERYIKGKEKLPPSEGYWLHHLAYLLRLTEKDAAKPAELETLPEIASRLSAGLDIKTEGAWTPLSAGTALSASPVENGYLGMTMEEFEAIVRGMDILYVTGRDGNKMKTMAGRTLEEIRNEILCDPTNLLDGVAVDMHKINPDEGGLGYSKLLSKAPLLGQQMASAGQRYLAATMKPELMMELLGEKAHRYLYGTLERAAEKEAVMTGEAMLMVDHLVSVYTRKERQAWQERNIMWWGGEKISKENILAMALNLGNEINRSRLAEGLSDQENPHIIDEIVARIEQHMTEKDWQFVQGVWDFLGQYWPETVRIEMVMNGTQLHPQSALPFTARTKEGKEIKMKGGYYPIVYNAEKNEQAREYSLDEEAKKSMQGAAALSTGLSSTKSRTQAEIKRRPLLLSLRVIPKHLGEVIHNQTHRIACRDVYHIIHDNTFADYVKKRMGAPFYENLKAWAIDVWQTQSAQLNQAEGDISKLMQGLRSNAALAIMGWRMWPVVENATNIFPAMHEIGAAEMMSAVGDFYANLGMYRELLHKSVFMASRMEHMDRDLKRQHHMLETEGRAAEWLKDHAYWCMEKTDLMFSAPLWCRAYKNAFAPKLAEVMAENEAAKKEIEAAHAEAQAAEAKVYDLVARQRAIEEELTRRQHGVPLTEETDLSRTPKGDLEAEAFQLNASIAEAERTAAEKQRRFDLVSERELKTPKEMNAEAEKRAIFAADRKVRNVFGSGDVKDLASVQKGGELMKLFTMFYGYFSVQANAILRAHYRGQSAKSWAPLASVILYRVLLTSALATLGRMMIFGEGDDDDKDKYRKDAAGNKIEIPRAERILKQYAKNTLSMATGMMVGVRDIGNFYINMAFEGTDYGRGMAIFGTATSRAVQEIDTMSKLIMAREEVNEKADLAEAKRKARYDKMTEQQKKKFDEEAMYRRPPRRISWLDISRSAAMTGTYLTANKFGVTDTMTNAVFSTMQYLWDDDGRYEASLRNMIIRSAIFGKKPVKRVIPERPKKEEKRRRRRR
nr:MAG TPA: crystallin beta/gamma motif-containing protein [Caudoviricetes sp.]